MTKTFYGYALASITEDQDVLLGQSARIEAAYHASYEAKGYTFGGVLLDPGVTSVKVRHNHLALSPLASRPAGMRLLQAVGQGDMILVTSLLRLFSRAPDLKHVLQIWGPSKIRVVSLEDNFSSANPDEIMDAFRAAHDKQKIKKIKASQAERRVARRKPEPKPRPKDMRQRNGKSVYLDRSIEQYLGGGGSRVYQDSCWCWARLLERNTAAVEGMFTHLEWQVMAHAIKGQEASFDPAWPDPGHVLAMWVERILAGTSADARIQDRLRGLSWSEAWAVIWALQYRLANNIKPTEPGWWSLTYREKQVVQAERTGD